MPIYFLSYHLHLPLLIVLLPLTHGVLHPSSPCPSVFSYEGAEPEADRWYGEVVVTTRDYLVGVRLNIQLDRRSHLLVSWLGEVTTTDNREYTVLNLDQRLDPAKPLTTKIMVRFDPSTGSPKVKAILLNGKQICPGDPPIQVNALNKNSTKSSSGGLKRPDPIFISDTIFHPSITTYDDYYSEFFTINQTKAMRKPQPDKVYANTESSVLEFGGYPRPSGSKQPTNPPRNEHNGGSLTPVEPTYHVPSSNVEYSKPVQNSNQGSTSQSASHNNKRKPQDETNTYEQEQTYNTRPAHTNTEEYTLNYNPRPPTNSESSYRPQQSNSETNYNSRPQVNTDTSFNSRPAQSSDSIYNTRPQTVPDSVYNSRPQTNVNTVYNPKPQQTGDTYDTRPQTNSGNVYNSGAGVQTIPETSYNSKPQTNFETNTGYNNQGNSRPQTNSGSNYNIPQSNNEQSYNPNTDTGYNTQGQATVISSNSRVSNQGQNSNSKKTSSSQTSNTDSNLSDIADLIEDTNTNKTVIITVIKHNPVETTTEAYKPTTQSSNKQKATSKPSSNTNGNSNKGQPLNTQHTQKKPNENKKPPSQTNNNNDNNNKDVSCGTVVSNKAQPLVTNGQKTARGQWPWHAALYKTEGINLSYICGGSLITSMYVITAAHCVTKKPYDKPVDSDTLVIYLGKYHQHQFSDEGGVQNKQVQRIHVYPSYNSSNYLGDVAILKLSSEVDYSVYVRPVCVWDEDTAPLQLSAVEGRDGTVIGWGYDENDRVSEELKMAIMPIVSHQQCLWSNPTFFSQFTSDETYCAGFRNGTSVCNGDSGGGMVFKIGEAWYLRGIVSITVARDGLRICDTKHYVVFTDVAKYLNWIRPIVN
uniref:Serine protease gd n=1 Tax=Cacopsylla melanoneura TaxID=428564 RepID=A0A8D8SCF4_9HEMI